MVLQLQSLFFEIHHPEKWSFAKISVINSKDGKTETATATPFKKATVEINENAQYWINAKIRVGDNSSDAYNTINISTISENHSGWNIIDIPKKQISIIAGMVVMIGIIGLVIKRKQSIVEV